LGGKAYGINGRDSVIHGEIGRLRWSRAVRSGRLIGDRCGKWGISDQDAIKLFEAMLDQTEQVLKEIGS
jgi:hypothetical protein